MIFYNLGARIVTFTQEQVSLRNHNRLGADIIEYLGGGGVKLVLLVPRFLH